MKLIEKKLYVLCIDKIFLILPINGVCGDGPVCHHFLKDINCSDVMHTGIKTCFLLGLSLKASIFM